MKKGLLIVSSLLFIIGGSTLQAAPAMPGTAMMDKKGEGLTGYPNGTYPPFTKGGGQRGRFFSLGFGISPLHSTFQPGMRAVGMPLDAFLQTGKHGAPFSYAIAFNHNATYDEELYELSSSHLSLQAHYNIMETSKVRFYGFAGISFWQADFELKPYPGITNYEDRVEEDSGTGLSAGLGASWKITPALQAGTRATVFAGQAEFLAGGFDRQPVQTGSLQLSVYVAYTFSFGKARVNCPSF